MKTYSFTSITYYLTNYTSTYTTTISHYFK
jgi:hypothetical protein